LTCVFNYSSVQFSWRSCFHYLSFIQLWVLLLPIDCQTLPLILDFTLAEQAPIRLFPLIFQFKNSILSFVQSSVITS
jgi:hypothetical protein